MNALLRRALSNQEIEIWGDGSTVRDFLHVDDLARLFVRVMESDHEGTFNAGSGDGTSVQEMIELVAKVTGRNLRLRYRPSRSVGVPASVLDCALANRTFGWTPEISLDAGLARTWDWMQSEAGAS